VDVLIVLGDQDGYHEAEHEVVSSPIWLSEILAEEGLTGLFLLQARRTEILLERGRHDVIASLRRHEIGLHGRDVHPNLPEAVEGLGWDEGVEAVLAIEGAELALLGRAFDRAPVCSSEHRRLGAPQLYGAMRRLGLPYLFGPAAAPPDYSTSWYAGALSVPFDAPSPEFLGFFPAVFDDALPDDAAFAGLFAQLRAHVERGLAVGLPLLSVFVCHPERLCYAGPLERWQYGNGRNRGRAAVPPGAEARRSRAEVGRALANFRTLVLYLRDAPGLEPTTVAEVVRRCGRQPATVRRDELVVVAEEALRTREIPLGPRASPAEALLGWADGLLAFAGSGAASAAAPRRDVLGPKEVPPLAPERPRLSAGQVVELARALVASVEASGHLPSALSVDGAPVGLGMFYGALAGAYLALARDGRVPEEIALDVWPRYPALAAGLDREFRRCAEDPLVRSGISTDAMALQARLQSWTLKPAVRGRSLLAQG
jgi:hypothetical protein